MRHFLHREKPEAIRFNTRTQKGCDYFEGATVEVAECFNTRTQKGCDSSESLARRYGQVSIHAPKKDATARLSSVIIGASFNTRTQKGCDVIGGNGIRGIFVFQYTHPKRMRLPGMRVFDTHLGFNTRTQKGCDMIKELLCFFVQFQYTHPKRMRL